MALEGKGDRVVGGELRKLVFSTENLPRGLSNRARYLRWRDEWNGVFGSADLVPSPDKSFDVRVEFTPVGEVGVGRFNGALTRMTRTPLDVAKDNADNFCIGLIQSPDFFAAQRSHDQMLAPGAMVLLTNAEPGEIRGADVMGWGQINIARSRLLELVPNADDLLGIQFDPSSEAARHLARYVNMLLSVEELPRDAALIRHIERTLLDLFALALGARREIAAVASMRGLRAARVQQILMEIADGYMRPNFSPAEVAHKLGLSTRYVHDLLHETGESFTERVIELRLQKARAMIADPRHHARTIGEIAYACGFNEISYFGRRFRARFGASPTQFRGANGATV
jgi:AraC-like DNA-binding protein